MLLAFTLEWFPFAVALNSGFLRRANGAYGEQDRVWLRNGQLFVLPTAVVVRTMARSYLLEPFPKFGRDRHTLNKRLNGQKAVTFHSSSRHDRRTSTS